MNMRVVGYIATALVLLSIGQMWVDNMDAKARDAEIAADAAWVTAEAMGQAVRASRARVIHVSDSLQALVVSAEARADSAAHRASEAVERGDSISVEIGVSRAEFRAALPEPLVEPFDRLIELDEERHLQMRIALSEGRVEVFAIRQGLRAATRINDELRAQLDREALAQAGLNEAIRMSQIEADRWKTAANPGFALGLWQDLPKLLVAAAGGAAIMVVASR